MESCSCHTSIISQHNPLREDTNVSGSSVSIGIKYGAARLQQRYLSPLSRPHWVRGRPAQHPMANGDYFPEVKHSESVTDHSSHRGAKVKNS